MTFAWSPPARSRALPAPVVRHVLYYFDGPKMVLALDERGRQLLGVAADEDAHGATRWVFAPAAPERVLQLVEKRTGLRALFDSGMLELHDIRDPWDSVSAWSLLSDDLPEDLLPERDAELPEITDSARSQLLAEQNRLMDQRSRFGRARLFFSGGPVRGRRGVSAQFAADVLSSYQALVSLAYGQRRKGALSSTGPIPDRGESTLMLTDMPRGSVGFELLEDAEQERVVPTDLAETVMRVGQLLDAAATSDPAYAEMVSEFDARIVGSLHAFFDKLRKSDAAFKLEAQGQEFSFEPDRLADAIERTASEPQEEPDRPVVGTLIGFLPTDRRFELAVSDRVIKGKLARDADVEHVASFFQKQCTAHLAVLTVRRAGHVAEAYTLKGVGPAHGG